MKTFFQFIFLIVNLKLIQTFSEIYISDRTQSPGNGTLKSPFNNLILGFSQINNISSLETTIYFIIVSDFLTILDSDINTYSNQLLLYDSNRYQLFSPANNKSLDITILPLNCYQNSNNSCINKVMISFKTERMMFLISSSLTLINVIFSGMDLPLIYNSTIDNSCYLTSECCNSSSYYTPNSRCFLSNKLLRRVNINYLNFSLFYMYVNNTTITLNNSEINNFYAINLTKGYGMIFKSANGTNISIILNNSTFYNTYFVYGLIKGMSIHITIQSCYLYNYNNASIVELEVTYNKSMNAVIDLNNSILLMKSTQMIMASGIFNILNSKLNVSDSTFTNINDFVNNLASFFFFLSSDNCTIYLENLFFDRNSLRYNGITSKCFIYLSGKNFFSMNNLVFSNSYINSNNFSASIISNQVIMKNCKFFNVSASLSSKAFFLFIGWNNTIYVENISFSYVNFSGNGGLFYAYSFNILDITKIFLNNSFSNINIVSAGCVIYFESYNNISMSQINVCNVAILNGKGGLFWGNSMINVLNVTNSSFYNISTSNEAAIGFFSIGSPIANSIITFKDCDIRNIVATISGACFFLQSYITLNLDSIFFNNIFSDYCPLVDSDLSATIFININEIYSNNTIVTGYAGVFYIESYVNFVVNNSIFKNSLAILGTAGLYFTTNTNLLLNNVYLYNMTTMLAQGASIFFVPQSNVKFNNLMIENSKTMNTYQPGGAIDAASGTQLYFFNCSFIDSWTATDQGGMIYIGESNNITFNSCLFCNNSANLLRGGALAIYQNNNVSIYGCRFAYSQSITGGAIHSELNNLILIDQTKIFTSFASNGAGIYCDYFTQINVSNSTFNSNMAFVNGGDFFLNQNNKLYIENSKFANSYSQNYAGSTYLNMINLLRVTSSSFNNSSEILGGIYFVDVSNNITFFDLVCVNASVGKEGGVISLNNYNNLSFINFYLDNFSGPSAGVIRALQQNYLTLSNFTLKNGMTSAFAFYSMNEVNLTYANFSYFTSYSFGCIIKLDYLNVVRINHSLFSNMASFFRAGGFFITDENLLFIDNSNFSDIQTLNLDGGLIWSKFFNSIYLTNLFIERIHSSDSGGLLYLELFNYIEIVNSTFTNISSAGEGGLIYSNYDNTVNITTCYFFMIMAQSKGGVFNLQTLNYILLYNISFSDLGVLIDFGGVLYMNSNNSFNATNNSFKNISFLNGLYGIFAYMLNTNFLIFQDNSIDSSIQNYDNASWFYSYSYNNILFSKIHFTAKLSFFLFYLTYGSELSISFLYLSQDIEMKVLFYLYYGNVTITSSNFNMKLDYNFMISAYSVINLRNYSINAIVNKNSFLIDVPSYFKNQVFERILFNISFSNIFFKKGQIKMNNTTDVFGLRISQGSIQIINTFIIGFQNNYSSYCIMLINIEYILFKKSAFILNKAFMDNGFLKVNNDNQHDKNELKFSRSIFISNSAQYNGGCIYSLNTDQIYIFTRNIFKRNVALNGGCLYMVNAFNISIENSSFTENKAKNMKNNITSLASKGGVIYIENQNIGQSSLLSIENSILINNVADIGGVLFHKGFIDIFNISNKIYQNIAKFYGNFSASEIHSLVFLEDILPEQSLYRVNMKILDNIVSGLNYTSCLGYIAGLDSYSQLAIMGDDDYLSLIELSYLFDTTPITFNYTIESGFICLSGPFLRDSLPVEATKTYQISFNNLNITTSLFLTVNYRPCIIGERLADNYSCVECLRGEYLFENNPDQPSPYCLVCGDSQPFYCFGGNRLTPKPGYWRKNTDSINFIQCADNVCLGDPRDYSDDNTNYNEIYAIGFCANGYQGILCNECIDGFGKIGDDECQSCNTFNYFGVILFFSLTKMVVSLICVHYVFNMGLDLFYKESNSRKKNIVISSLMKIWINHIEIMATILFFPINWSSEIKNFLKYLFLVSLKIGDSLPLECLKNYLNFDIRIIYFKLILTIIYPCVLMILNFLYISLQSLVQKKFKNERWLFFSQKTRYPLLKTIPMICLAILLFCYSDIMKVCLEMVQFLNIGDSSNVDYRLVADRTVIFESDEYIYWFFRLDLPLIFIYGILFPCIIFGYLIYKYKKNDLYHPKILYNFSLFYYTYDRNYSFWEIIVILRKAILVFIQLYSFSSTNYRSLYPMILMLSVLLIATGLQIYCKPYKSELNELNQLEFSSLIALCTTFYLGIFYSMPTILGTVSPWYYNYLFITTGSFANLIFLVTILHILLKSLRMKLKSSQSLKNEYNKNDSNSSYDNNRTSIIKLKFSKNINNDSIEKNSFVVENECSRSTLDRKNEVNMLSTLNDEKIKNLNLNNILSPPPLVPLTRPLSIIEEQTSQEKIYRTYLEVKNETKNVKDVSKKMKRMILDKIFEKDDIKTSLKDILTQNRTMYSELLMEKSGKLLDIDSIRETIFEYYEDLNTQINAQYDLSLYTHTFLDENWRFYDACLNNARNFIINDHFTVKSSYDLFGNVNSLIFLRLVLTFTATQEIDEFEMDTKMHDGKKYYIIFFLLCIILLFKIIKL